MVIEWVERELSSPCNRLPFANGIRQPLNDIRLNFDLKRSLRRWPVLDKNVKHSHDVGLSQDPVERKLVSLNPVLAILMSFWTPIDYFKFLASHLTIFSYISLAHWDGSSLSPSGLSSSWFSSNENLKSLLKHLHVDTKNPFFQRQPFFFYLTFF